MLTSLTLTVSAMPSPSERSLRLLWTGEFSPGQLGENALAETLAIVDDAHGRRDEAVEAIRQRWFLRSAAARQDPVQRVEQQRKRAGNVLIGMQQYGLITSGCLLTELGQELHAEGEAARRSDRFARHLLRNGHGLELLNVVRDLQQRRVTITNDTLRGELRQRGYKVNTNSGDAGKLKQWLGTAGIVSAAWDIDEARVAELTGLPLSAIGEWQSLSRSQRAFLATIRRLGETRGTRPIPSPELVDFVRQEQGPVFDEGQVRRIYGALASGGWVVHSAPKDGRGGKGGTVAATDKLLNIDFELLLGFRPGDLPADLRAARATPLDEVYRDLTADSTYAKGIALELLALNMAVDLGLTPLSLRVRGIQTGGSEVDLVAEAAHLHFSRWLFQCKNTRSVDVGVLAKEVGMATLLQAQVILIATTGTFTRTVKTYAGRVAETTPFQVVLADRDLLATYQSGGAVALRKRVHDDATEAMRLKRPQVLATLEELIEDNS